MKRILLLLLLFVAWGAQAQTTVAPWQGGTGLNVGVSGGIMCATATKVFAFSTALTANLPVIGGGAGVCPSSGTRSGNTTAFMTGSGTFTLAHVATFDASGNIIDGGSPVTNPMSTLGDLPYGGASGAFTRLAGPTGVNSVPQVLTEIPSAGAATAPVWSPAGASYNAQTGASYTVLATDRASYVSHLNGSAIPVTLPASNSTGFASNFIYRTKNLGAGLVTITPTTSTIDGVSSVAVNQGDACTVFSDNTNYFTVCNAPPALVTAPIAVSRTAAADTFSCPTCLVSTTDVTVAQGGTGVSTLTAHAVLLGEGTSNVASVGPGATNALLAGVSAADPVFKALGDLEPTLYVAGGGTAQAQTVTLAPAATSLVAGLTVRWVPTAANTAGAPTLAVNGLTAKTITKCGTTALVANDLTTAALATATYDGTQFQLLNPQAAGCGTASAGVSSFSGDGTFATNSGSTGGVTLALSTASAHSFWGNNTGSTGAAGYHVIGSADLPVQYTKGSCTEVWGGTGTSNALTSGDDAISNNTCYNDSGVTRTITAVKCRSDVASNTTTVNPTFGSAGTGTTVLSGALTCGSSLAYSSTGTVTNASWTTGTGVNPGQGGTLTGTSIAVIVEYTF